MLRIAFSKFVYSGDGVGLDFMHPCYTLLQMKRGKEVNAKEAI